MCFGGKMAMYIIIYPRAPEENYHFSNEPAHAMNKPLALTPEVKKARQQGEDALSYLNINTSAHDIEPGGGYLDSEDETQASLGISMLEGALLLNDDFEPCKARWNAVFNTEIRTDLGYYKLPQALIVAYHQDEMAVRLMRSFLGEGGLDPNSKDQCDRSLLTLCAVFNAASLAQVVLESGADVNATFDAGHGVMKVALTIAEESGSPDVARVIHAFKAKRAVDAALAQSIRPEPI